jgi:Kef-type K+ transport system membrane component KefB
VVVGTVEASLLILVVIILVGPVLAEKVGIPGLVGLILGGMIVGPFVLGWEEQGGLISALGAIGILYLMFLAGLSFNLKSFAANRGTAVGYGLLGFSIPFVLSVVVSLSLLGYSFLAALLIGAMWASNTLVAYPEVQAAGLADNRAVGTAVSAGVIADILSLTVLAFVSSNTILESEEPELTATTSDPALPLWLGVVVLAVFTLWILPRVTRWFFAQIGHTRTQRFVFVLAGMAAGAVVALLGGMEGLIGAFLAGLGMNRLVPKRGALMAQIEFFGDALFIPAFLVSIGLSIDPRALFDLETVGLALVFTALVVTGKGAASLIAGLVYKFSTSEVGLMSALGVGQAASTLAIAQIGFDLGLFDQKVVNAAVLTVVATAFITSYASRFFAGRVERPAMPEAPLGTKVLTDTRTSGVELEGLVRLAGAISEPDGGLVVPFAVHPPGQRELGRAAVDAAESAAEKLGLDTDGLLRMDEPFSDGTLGLVEEQDASLLMLAWPGPSFAPTYLYGNDIDLVGERSPVPTIAAHVVGPWERLVLVTGNLSNEWKRDDVGLAFAAARRIVNTYPTPVLILTPKHQDPTRVVGDVRAEIVEYDRSSGQILNTLRPGDLLLVTPQVVRRSTTLAQWKLARALREVSVAVIAGPGRLTVSSGTSSSRVHGAVGRTT